MKTFAKILLHTSLAATGTTLAASPEAFVLPPRTYTLPLMKAPALDGTLNSNEWPTLGISRLIESAIPTQPMTPSMFLHGRNGGIQIGSDGTNLFIAYRTSVHPQYGAIYNGKRDPIKEPLRLCQDDSVEIWIDPSPESTNAVATQIIGNANGDTVGLFFPRGSSSTTSTWPVSGFRQAHSVTNGEWLAEYSLPLAALGIKDVSVPFGVRLCRSFIAPGNQCRWEAGSTLFNDPKTMCLVSFREKAPIVQETGFFDDKGMNLGLTVSNATASSLELFIRLEGSVDGTAVGREWTETLRSGDHKSFSLTKPIPANAARLCEAQMTVTDKDGTPYFTRTAKWNTPLEAQWTPITVPRPSFTTDVEFAWSPVSKSLTVNADYAGLPNNAAIRRVRWEVTSTNGTPCGGGSAVDTPASQISGTLPLPALKEGVYELRVFFDAETPAAEPTKILRFAHLDLLDTLAEASNKNQAVAVHQQPSEDTLNRLGTPFTSHMVMQRGKPIPVWGWTHVPNQTVTVTFAGKTKSTVSDASGFWRVFYDARKKGGPYTLKVSGIPAELTDIVMGDVWVCAGQSNMHFGLDMVNGIQSNAQEVIAQAINPNLRLLFIPGNATAETCQEHSLLLDAKREYGIWQPCTPTNVLLANVPGSWRGFSAVGYFFGQTIQKSVDVPVGLIEMASGGTIAETWTSPIGLAGVDNTPLPPFDLKNARSRSPSAFYNGTVAPVLPLPIKGILWYQGESNSGNARYYERLMANLIRDWRLQFRQGDIPFYFVQICGMDGYMPFDVAWAHLRESQLRVAQRGLPNVAMAVSYDLEDDDNPWDVHPRNKQAVADRLARIALARDYGKKEIVYTSPTYREMKHEGNRIRLFFDHAENGLVSNGGELHGFRILDDQMRLHDANAVIDGETVVVSAPGVENPAHVRYAFVQYTFPKPNLYNKAGLPASPFRTDTP